VTGTEATGWRRWAPGLAVLRSYDRTWLRGDLIAGVTVAAYLVPQVMAYAEIVGLPAVTGLWATLAPLAVYALLGSSRQLSMGPESTTALMTAAGIAALVGEVGVARRTEVAALLALAVGLVCLVGHLARLGFLANLLSSPVLTGYMAGIAVLMIVSQYSTLTGLQISGDTPWQETVSLVSQLGAVHLPTLALGLAVVALLFVLRRWAPGWPGPLLVMLLAAAVVWAAGLSSDGIALIGQVPSDSPVASVPDPTGVDLLRLVPAALGIAVVGYGDVILTGRSFAARHSQRIDATQELLALGAANLANGLLAGFPVSSSASRTVIGDSAGSRTQLHSLVAAAAVLGSIYVFAPVLAAFPVAALGGVVVYAAIRLINVPELRRIARFRRSELVLALITFVAVLATGLLTGVGIAVGLEDYPRATQVPGLVVYRYDSPLFFANADDFLTRAMAAVRAARPEPLWFVLNAEANVEVDLTAVDTLEQLRATLTDAGVVFAMARVKLDVREQLDAAGFVDRVGDDRIFATLPTAVEGFAQWYAETTGVRPAGLPAPPTTPASPTEQEEQP
jgi:SulP family sulfate permease